MRRLIVIGVLGAAGVYAYRNGYLQSFRPYIDKASRWTADSAARAAAAIPRPDADQIAEIKALGGGRPVPILGADEVVNVNPFEHVLRSNWQYVSGWARANVHWAAAILATENRGLNPKAVGDNGAAHGLFQVHVPTAQTCYRAGYTQFEPTAEVLHTVAGGVYFGTAEMERLSRLNGSADWIVKAYNGGAGWEHEGDRYRKDREAYYRRASKNLVQLYGRGMV